LTCNSLKNFSIRILKVPYFQYFSVFKVIFGMRFLKELVSACSTNTFQLFIFYAAMQHANK
jgi:hypothetical protein